jgi:hypothetical protein
MTVQANNTNSFIFNDPKIAKKAFPPELRWYPLTQSNWRTIQAIPESVSFLSGYDVDTHTVKWEQRLLQSDLKRPTIANISASKGVVYVQPNALELQVRKSSDGSLIKSFPTKSAGNSAAIILNRDIYLCSGRGGFQAESPDGTAYSSTDTLYQFKLPRCQCSGTFSTLEF